jgi:tyrosine-protein phosphatase YwqE
MFTIINRKKKFPLHHFFGVEIKKIHSSFYLPLADSSLNLIIGLGKLGEKKLALTSHATGLISSDYDFISQKAKELEKFVDFTTSQHKGLEIALVHSMKEWYQLIVNNELTSLDDRYVFFKTWPEQIVHEIENFAFELQMNRYVPVLVFPEKKSSFKIGRSKLSRLEEKGVAFQIDCLSLSGFNGKRAEKIVVSLMENESVGFISLSISDLPKVIENDKILVSRKVADLLDFQLF